MQTARLDMIISHISKRTVADVGTDHAYIPITLADNDLADKIIATDINKGPLNSARKNVVACKNNDRIELRLGPGLEPIKVGECDEIIIAGMGGELIAKILDNSMEVAQKAECLLLQPMTQQDSLRRYLSENSFEIVDEDIEIEGFKVYNLIIARYGGKTEFSDEFSLHLPEYLYHHKNFSKLLAKKKREFTKILSGLNSAKQKDENNIERVRNLLDRCIKLEAEI